MVTQNNAATYLIIANVNILKIILKYDLTILRLHKRSGPYIQYNNGLVAVQYISTYLI